MINIPLGVVFAIIAFNVTMFTIPLELDILKFHSIYMKIMFLVLTIGWWHITYVFWGKWYTIHLPR